jgi:hypothetical protein
LFVFLSTTIFGRSDGLGLCSNLVQRYLDVTVGDEHSGILLLKFVIGNSQVDTRSTIILLMGKLNAGMANVMASHNQCTPKQNYVKR